MPVSSITSNVIATMVSSPKYPIASPYGLDLMFPCVSDDDDDNKRVNALRLPPSVIWARSKHWQPDDVSVADILSSSPCIVTALSRQDGGHVILHQDPCPRDLLEFVMNVIGTHVARGCIPGQTMDLLRSFQRMLAAFIDGLYSMPNAQNEPNNCTHRQTWKRISTKMDSSTFSWHEGQESYFSAINIDDNDSKVDQKMRDLGQWFEHRGISASACDAEMRCRIMCDWSRIAQIIGNDNPNAPGLHWTPLQSPFMHYTSSPRTVPGVFHYPRILVLHRSVTVYHLCALALESLYVDEKNHQCSLFVQTVRALMHVLVKLAGVL